ERVFLTVVDWRTNASKDGMPTNGTYSVEDVRALDTHRTPIQKQPEMLLCMVKTGSCPRAPHEVLLLTLTATRVIEMDETAIATDSSGVPSTIERSPLDFAHEAEASGRGTAAPEMPPPDDVPTTTAPGDDQAVETVAAEPHAAQESRKRGHDGTDANAPPKSLRRDHADLRPSCSSRGGKSLAAMQLCLASNVFVSEGVHADVSDPDPLAFANAPSSHPADVAQSSQGVAAAGDPESENVSSPAEVGSPGSVYQPEWGVTNGSLLDTPEACQDLVDHAAPRIRAGGQAVTKIGCSGGSPGLKNPSPGVRNKKPGNTAEDRGRYEEGCRREEYWVESRIGKNACPVLGTSETMKAAFEEYKRQQDQLVEQRCAEMDARLDALSIDFDKELYPHMLTAIAGRKWVIGHGLRLAMMKCTESLEMRQAFADVVYAGVAKGMSEGLKHGVEHGHARLTVESLEAYDPEAEAKFAAALQSLKDLKVILGGDASQFIRNLRPSSSQLTIPVYPEVRDPRNPWACKEEIGLADAIAANISRGEQKKRSRIVCRTHGVGSVHHARSDRVPVSAPIVVPQGLALLLVDAATQTESDDA
nr:hypothetical protein [Tanacetum cinerariifolium]